MNFDSYLSLLVEPDLEKLAARAHDLTLKNFGRTILLYAPIYLNNECDNQCAYCGFSKMKNGVTLSVAEVQTEAEILYGKGFRHVLLVAGEKRGKVTQSYLKEVITSLHDRFDSIGLEIFPLEEAEYRELFLAGADGLTVYQEVYDRAIYKKMHGTGPKSDYDYRLATPERAGRAGFYRINIGALLGLNDWYSEAAALGRHAAQLKQKFWQAQISVSFPRLQPSASKFKPPHSVSDRQLVQMICALRIYQPTLGLVLSTRESAELRDNLISLGITQMSAGSSTQPGGYSRKFETEEQFEIADTRSVERVAAIIAEKGYEPVFKDWDRAYINGRIG